VAERAAALDSGPTPRKAVGVQTPPPAPSPPPPMPQATASADRLVAQNRRASHDYAILETLEAGLVLAGTEVKSLRNGKASLQEAWGTIEAGGACVYHRHIPPYGQGKLCNRDAA